MYPFGMVESDDIIPIYIFVIVCDCITLTTFAPLELVEYIILQIV